MMKFLCLLAITAMLGLVWAAPQTNSQDDDDDGYDFTFNTGSHFRKEKKTSDGKTLGEYGFRTPDGCMHVTKYQADQQGGYRVLGSSKRGCTKSTNRRPSRLTTTTIKPPSPITSRITTTTPIPKPRFPNPTTTRIPFTTRPTTTRTSFPTRPTTTRFPFTTRATTRTPSTTTNRIPFTTRTTTTTTPKPSNSLSVSPVPQVNNDIEENESQGRQLNQPTLTTPKNGLITTSKPGENKKPDPLYSYGYTAPSHGHTETGLPDGSKKGEYYWDSPDGWRRIVTYEANERGFFPKMRRVRIPTTTPKPPPVPENEGGVDEEGNPIAKELAGPDQAQEIALPKGGCPYYFYYNTRINYQWEHCHENSNKTGEFGKLGSDGFFHKTWYYADGTGFHPKVTRTPLTRSQEETMAEYSKKTFIIPKPKEERRQTERRIQEWLSENRDKIENPLR